MQHYTRYLPRKYVEISCQLHDPFALSPVRGLLVSTADGSVWEPQLLRTRRRKE
jgi:hypothetical protein